MAERKIIQSGQALVFDRAVSADAKKMTEFLRTFSIKSDPVYLEHLFASYPAFHASLGDKTIALCYGLGHRPDMIEISLLLLHPDFQEAGVEEEIKKELLRLFEEKALSWQNVLVFLEKEKRDFWQEAGYSLLLESEDSLLLHKKI